MDLPGWWRTHQRENALLGRGGGTSKRTGGRRHQIGSLAGRDPKSILEAVDFYLQKAKDEGNTADTLNKKTRIFKGLLGGSPGAPQTLAEKIESTKKVMGKFSPSLLTWAEERGLSTLKSSGYSG